MTTELDALPESVREAVAAIDNGSGVFVDSDDGIGGDKWQTVRAELLRLAARESDSKSIIQKLQAIVVRWLPCVRAGDDPLNDQIGDDAYGLFGYEGDDQPQYGDQIYARMERAEARERELERENEILAIKNRGTLANNLCPDHRDKQTGKPCLACTIETLTRKKDRAEAELATLKHAMVADADKARDFPANTCPASRHVQLIGEALIAGEPYPMLAREPQAGAMLATVKALWETRTELAALKKLVAEAYDGLGDLPGEDGWAEWCARAKAALDDEAKS